MRLLSTLLLLAALAPTVAHAEEPLVVVALGDSTTAPRVGVEQVWPQRLATVMHGIGKPAVVLNAGVSGDTTVGALARFERDVAWRRPDLVVVQLGINDAAVDVHLERSEPRVPLADYEANVASLVARVRALGAQVVLMTPNPLRWTEALRERRGREPYDVEDPRGLDTFVARYAEAVRRVARREDVPLVDVHTLFDERGVEGAAKLLLDGAHPNDLGHGLVVGALVALVARLELRPWAPTEPALPLPPRKRIVHEGRATLAFPVSEPWSDEDFFHVGAGVGNDLLAGVALREGDFRIEVGLSLDALDGTASSIELGYGSHFGFDGASEPGGPMYASGSMFEGGVTLLGPTAEHVRPGETFAWVIERAGRWVSVRVDGAEVHRFVWAGPLERIALRPWRGTMRVREWTIAGSIAPVTKPRSAAFTLPVVDLAPETERQVVVDREAGQYLGHPTTVLLEDGRTMICVYPKGHGRGAIVMKRSTDGGLTWSERLPTPDSWATSKETPTIHRVVDAAGTRRLILFSGLYPIRMAVSADDGASWSELEPIGDFGGIVAMGAVERVGDGRYMALFHDDGRFFRGSGRRAGFHVYATFSDDGGLTWGEPVVVASHPHAHLCEPGIVRSPDGERLAMLLRENSRRFNSHVCFSDDEGATWSPPIELPAALTGDRHIGRYAPDGRLVLTFRDTTRVSPTQGDWVGWVGTWDDLVAGREGQYRFRLMDNHVRGDCAYPGFELLPDGTFVATTYGHWSEGEEPYVVSVRFRIDELDERAEAAG